MYCPKCGAKVSEGDSFCQQCGHSLSQTPTTSAPTPASNPISASPVYVQMPAEVRRTSGLAVASLILGILGISILAIIFGGIAMSNTAKDPYLSGRGMAVAGLILGIIGLIGTIIVVAAIVAGFSWASWAL